MDIDTTTGDIRVPLDSPQGRQLMNAARHPGVQASVYKGDKVELFLTVEDHVTAVRLSPLQAHVLLHDLRAVLDTVALNAKPMPPSWIAGMR